jgi:hypothetical protein
MSIKRHGMAFLAQPIGTSAAGRCDHVAKRPRSCRMEIMIACRLRVRRGSGQAHQGARRDLRLPLTLFFEWTCLYRARPV